ncbi:MAG: hypothetical protein AB7P20_00855 [Rhizobiaceae bacterium]
MSRTVNATRSNWRTVSMLLVAASVAVFVAANAHLIYVAFASRPDCVAHEKPGSADPTSFGAAKSSC